MCLVDLYLQAAFLLCVHPTGQVRRNRQHLNPRSESLLTNCDAPSDDQTNSGHGCSQIMTGSHTGANVRLPERLTF